MSSETPKRSFLDAARWLFSAPDWPRLRTERRILGGRLGGLARDLLLYGLAGLGLILPGLIYLDRFDRRSAPKNQPELWDTFNEIQGHMLAGRPLRLAVTNTCATPAEALALAQAWRERPQALPDGACRPAAPRWNSDLRQAELHWPCGDRCADAIVAAREALAQDWGAARPVVTMKDGRLALEVRSDPPLSPPRPRECDRRLGRPSHQMSRLDFAEAAMIRLQAGEIVISVSPDVARWMRDRRRANRNLDCLVADVDDE